MINLWINRSGALFCAPRGDGAASRVIRQMFTSGAVRATVNAVRLPWSLKCLRRLQQLATSYGVTVRVTPEVNVKLAMLREEAADVACRLNRPKPPGSLYLHQWQSASFAAGRRCIIADPVGLGKTRTALSAAALADAQRILLVAPLTMIGVWEDEVQRWGFDWQFTQLAGTPKQRAAILKDFRGGILAVNWALLWKHCAELTTLGFDQLIADEAHYAKNRKARRSRALRELALSIPNVCLVTATPGDKVPQDLWHLLHILYPDRFPSFWAFVERYAQIRTTPWGKEIAGIRPDTQEILADELSLYMIRHDPSVVDLPPVTVQRVPLRVPSDILRRYDRLVREVVTELDSGERVTITNALARLTRLREFSVTPERYGVEGSPKLDAVVELVDSFPEHEGAVICCDFKAPLMLLKERLLQTQSRPVFVLTGETPWEERHDILKRAEPGTLLLITPGVGGEGLTLTQYRFGILVTLPLSSLTYQQVIGRLHRQSQTRPVVWYWLRMTALDDHIWGLIQSKLDQATLVMRCIDLLRGD